MDAPPTPACLAPWMGLLTKPVKPRLKPPATAWPPLGDHRANSCDLTLAAFTLALLVVVAGKAANASRKRTEHARCTAERQTKIAQKAEGDCGHLALYSSGTVIYMLTSDSNINAKEGLMSPYSSLLIVQQMILSAHHRENRDVARVLQRERKLRLPQLSACCKKTG